MQYIIVAYAFKIVANFIQKVKNQSTVIVIIIHY